MVRLKLSNIQENCLSLGFEFLDEKYRNNSFKHTFKCLKHDQVFKSCFKSIHKGVGLRCCRLDRVKQWLDFRKHTISEVEDFCLKAGFRLIDKKYLHVNYRHFFRCLQHNRVHRASYKQIKRGIGLECCHKKITHSGSEEYTLGKLESLGFKLLGEFEGINSKTLIKCKKHGKTLLVTVRSIVRDHRKFSCCRAATKPLKKSRPKLSPKSSLWENDIKMASDFKCFVCKAKDLTDKSSVAVPVELDNKDGICLCSGCNVLFHKTYGFSGATQEQFEEFVASHKKDYGGRKAVFKKLNWNR